MDAATNLVIAQAEIPEKTNEMTAIPKLLAILDITGSTVTIDAIGATGAILRMTEGKDGYSPVPCLLDHLSAWAG